ncbi:MAG: rod shape-determining protein MreC [Candidatus Omnitrophica bacterium]|nr:rod shape-determining protein MreC [Candidatus Omnitrophota bacterium]
MFRSSQRKFIYFLILALPFFILFFNQNIFSGLRTAVISASSWPIKIVTFPLKEVKKILFYRKTFNENRILTDEVKTLRRRLIEQEEVLKENSRFKNLLDFQSASVFSSVAASVVGRDPSNWSAVIVIDRGEVDGLEQGMPVVSSLGVIGKILEVGSRVSKVMLLTDPSFSVAAIIQRNREQGLVSGTLQGICRMQYLSPESKINIGDNVITSKLSSFFPEGLLVGKVIAVQDSPGSPTIECFVEPAVSLSQIEEVIVLKIPRE